MELYQLKTFAAVAEERHLTRAAERVHLSQPAVSGHIKALETELGVRLFERSSTGMELTAAGGELLEHARRVLLAADDVKRAAQQMQGDIAGMLRVGTVADPESNRLGELLALARDTHPRLKLELHHAMSGAALAGVQGGELLEHARRVLLAADDVKRAAQQMQGDIAGMLRVGTVADPESNRLGELLALARDTHPRLKLELHHAMSGAALAGVQGGELDASFFFGDAPGAEFFALPLRRLIYRVAAPVAWADRVDGAQWDEISGLPWIGTPDISTHTRLVSDLFAQRSLPPPKAAVQADDEGVVTALVVSGLGLALVRDDVARRLERTGDVVIWTRAAIDTALWFVCLSARIEEPIIGALLDLARKTWNLDATTVDEVLEATSA